MSIQIEDTPILRRLIMHANKSNMPLHVPGHHQGRDLPEIFSEWLGQASKIDLTELPGLDNLHNPEACILESEMLAAAYYGSRKCFYSVNGSTAGVMAAILSCVSERKKILFLNPFHMSAWRGVIIADAIPRFMPFIWDDKGFTYQAPIAEMLAERLEKESDFKAIYLTSPTYQGRIANVSAIVQAAHKYDIPVIVDEAHGAHLSLIPAFPKHSVAAGADMVIQSAHKTLPSLTQAAWVHVQGKLIDPSIVMYYLNFLQTTSPSYLLMASLDVAQAWLRKAGKQAALDFIEQRTAVFPFLNETNLSDPLRHWIPIGNRTESKRLKSMLEESSIYVEMADTCGVLAMFGFYMKRTHFERYNSVLEAWRQSYPGPDDSANLFVSRITNSNSSQLLCTPKEAQFREKRVTPLSESIGQICGSLVTPYPPGVPVLLPGQRIESNIIDIIEEWLLAGHEIHGLEENKGIKTLV